MAKIRVNEMTVELGSRDESRGQFYFSLYHLLLPSKKLGNAPGQTIITAPDNTGKELLYYLILQKSLDNFIDQNGEKKWATVRQPNIQEYGLTFAYALCRGLTDWELEGAEPELKEIFADVVRLESVELDPKDSESRKRLFTIFRDWLTLGAAAPIMLRLTCYEKITPDNPEEHVHLGLAMLFDPTLVPGTKEADRAVKKLCDAGPDSLKGLISGKVRWSL